MSAPHRRPRDPSSPGAALRRTGVRLVAALVGATVVVVITPPGHRARLVPADRGFAIWLDGAPGELHAFCP